MKNRLKLNDPQTARRNSIVDMGLGFSAMIRLFEVGSKEKLRKEIFDVVEKVSEAESEKQFRAIHSSFCNWGVQNIRLTKKDHHASYGQIAKTLNVVLKVAVHHCHLPDYEKSQ